MGGRRPAGAAEVPVKLTFVNELFEVVQLVWVQEGGAEAETLMAYLGAETRMETSSFVNHAWRVLDMTGDLLLEFMPDQRGAVEPGQAFTVRIGPCFRGDALNAVASGGGGDGGTAAAKAIMDKALFVIPTGASTGDEWHTKVLVDSWLAMRAADGRGGGGAKGGGSGQAGRLVRLLCGGPWAQSRPRRLLAPVRTFHAPKGHCSNLSLDSTLPRKYAAEDWVKLLFSDRVSSELGLIISQDARRRRRGAARATAVVVLPPATVFLRPPVPGDFTRALSIESNGREDSPVAFVSPLDEGRCLAQRVEPPLGGQEPSRGINEDGRRRDTMLAVYSAAAASKERESDLESDLSCPDTGESKGELPSAAIASIGKKGNDILAVLAGDAEPQLDQASSPHQLGRSLLPAWHAVGEFIKDAVTSGKCCDNEPGQHVYINL